MSSAASAVLVVGSYNHDLVFTTRTFPRAGQTVFGSYASGPGGKGSNQALACAAAGGRVRFVAAVGDDAFAVAARELHARAGVVAHWAVKGDRPTGTAGIVVEGTGQNLIVAAPGANAALGVEDVPGEWLASAGVVVGQLEVPWPATKAILAAVRSGGGVAILNPAPMPEVVPVDLTGAADVLVPNETEFAALVSSPHGLGMSGFEESALASLDPADVHALCRRLGPGVVILTLGGRGCLVSTRTGWQRWPALAGVVPVDTVGAGDAFVGGLAAGWSATGGDLAAAVRLGTVVAGLSVTRHGAAAALPSRAEVEAALPRYPKEPEARG